MRRAKESLPAALELSPVRLIGGFVCVDSHLGCAGCHFCLNRRYPAQRAVLERRLHRDWAEVGLPPERLAALVAALPAVKRGGVPIRFAHLSDLVFEVDGARALLAALPPTHPVLLLTRFPPALEVGRLLEAHPNAMLHLSITPTVPGAIHSDVPEVDVLAAAARVPPGQLFVMLGPLVEGSEGPIRRLLPLLPRGAAVGFKPLAADGLPFPIGVAPLGAAQVTSLAAEARAQGLDVPPMAGCRLRTRLAIPFFRSREFADGVCDGCPNRAVCGAVPEPGDAELKHEAAAVLGLRVHSIERTSRGVTLEVDAPVARADETYLSERLRWPVWFSGVTRGEAFQVVEVSQAVLDRWERVGFLPVLQLAALARQMSALAGLA